MMACPVAAIASRSPDHVLFVSDHFTLTAIQLDHKIRGYAHHFSQRGVLPQVVIALHLMDPIEQCAAILACWRLKAWPMPLNPRFPSVFVQTLMEKTNAQLLITHPNLDQSGDVHDTDLAMNQIGLVMWTSGSSGFPKPVVLSIGNLFWNAKGVIESFPFSAQDRVGLELPLHHIGGFSALLRALLAQVPVYIVPKKEKINFINVNKITHVSWVPTQLIRVLKEENPVPPSLRQVLIGGDSLSHFWSEQAKHWPLLQTYGMTEMGSQIQTAGKILPYCEMKVDAQSEIWVKGRSLFQGYLEVGSSQPIVHLCTDGDGWFRTGDCGKIGADGKIEVKGRRSGMMISGGENIYFAEVEQVLLSHPDVIQAVVRAVPDPEWGERLVAVVRMTHFDSELLKDWLKERVPFYWVPKQVLAWPTNWSTTGIKPTQAQWNQVLE